jgi:hypothetical protein
MTTKLTFSWNGINSTPSPTTFVPPNYPAGANAWNGQPNSVAPPASYLTPAMKAPAPVLNYILSQIATDLVSIAQFDNEGSAATTIASASNGFSLPQGTINVASTAAFASSGEVYVATADGIQAVQYTGITPTSFTGCTGGIGAMSTGGAVAGLTPDGNGFGMRGTGAGGYPTGDPGLTGGIFTGGAGNQLGALCQGSGTGAAVSCFGGGGGGSGGLFSGSGAAAGVVGVNTGSGSGGAFTGGPGGGAGVTGIGQDNAAGGAFTGAGTGVGVAGDGFGGAGGAFRAHSGNAPGAACFGFGNGDGVDGTAGTGTGCGGYFIGSSTTTGGSVGQQGAGVVGVATGGGPGVVGFAASLTLSGHGGDFTGSGIGPGVNGFGGALGNGPGGVFMATGTANGCAGVGAGGTLTVVTGAGGTFAAAAAGGSGVYGWGVDNGAGVVGVGGTPTGSPLGVGAGGHFATASAGNGCPSVEALGGPILLNTNSPATPVANAFYADCIPKAYGMITTSGSGAGPATVGAGALNVASAAAAQTGSEAYIQITLATPMANTNYTIVPGTMMVGGFTGTPSACVWEIIDASNFRLASAADTLTTVTVTTFMVMGQQ